MKRYCAICHSIHEGKCERPKFRKARNSEADRFRNTQAWRRFSSVIVERDLSCCRMCLKSGLVNSNDLSVHHIVPLAVDFERRLDDSNAITLCRFHHEKAESGRISKQELLKLAAETPQIPKL